MSRLLFFLGFVCFSCFFISCPCFSANGDIVKWYFQDGALSFRSGDYKRSIDSYTKVIKMIEDSNAYAMGQYKDCVRRNKCPICPEIPINPNYSEAYFNRGLARKNFGDHEGALSDFEKARQLYEKQENWDKYQKTVELMSRYR